MSTRLEAPRSHPTAQTAKTLSNHSGGTYVIRKVLAGKVALSHATSERVLLRSIGVPGWPGSPTVASLSDRELEVFTLIGQGLSTRPIADRLHLSIHTIESHRENIKAKLNLRSGAELARDRVDAKERLEDAESLCKFSVAGSACAQ